MPFECDRETRKEVQRPFAQVNDGLSAFGITILVAVQRPTADGVTKVDLPGLA
jgi:hypothetical protein